LDRQILSCAASLAGRMSGDLHVVHTYIPAALAAVVAGRTLGMTPESEEGLQVENSFTCSQVERLVSDYGVKREHLHVEMGTLQDCMTQMVTQYHADLMVIGASSHGRFHRMIAGSTASTILESFTCDILIVKSSGEGAAISF